MNKPLIPGLYVHVPFCRTKCPYCAFYSIPSLSLVPEWMEAIQKEILRCEEMFPGFDSLYLGGGTPTVLNPGQWSGLMETLYNHLPFSPDSEITVEANPDGITPNLVHLLRRLGINRISLGIQSFNDRELDFLRRRHTSHGGMGALECLRNSGFTNIGVDLMFGLPGQTEGDWLATLRQALDFVPEHISCYEFTIEEGTHFGKMRDRGMIRPPQEERVRALFLLTSRFLEAEGYLHYEISNYARGRENVCRHNMKYWQHAPYLGLGPSAHSYREDSRWWNLASVEDYCQALSRGMAPVAGRETLSGEQLYLEDLLLGLRTMHGVELKVVSHRPQVERVLGDLKRAGLVRVEEGRIKPTRAGFLVADSLPLLF